MKEYIERAALIDDFKHCGASKKIVDAIVSRINRHKAADVAPVRHGRWGEYESFPLAPSLNGHPCSECGMHFSQSTIPIMNYCPNCGALMDKEAKHDKHPPHQV